MKLSHFYLILALVLFSFLNISYASFQIKDFSNQKLETTQDYFLKTNGLNQFHSQLKNHKELNKSHQPFSFDLAILDYNFDFKTSYQLNKIVFFYSLIPYDHCLIGKQARAPPSLLS